MPANKKPRKAHRPLRYATNPLDLLMGPEPVQGMTLMLRFNTAIEAMTRGEHPGEAEWRDLADCINTLETMVLDLKLVTPTIMNVVKQAEAAMAAAAIRFKAGQGMRVDGVGLVAIRMCIAYYADCMGELTHHQMAMARSRTQARLNALLHKHAAEAEVIAL